MSYDIKEKDCEQSDGDDGEWILSYTDKKNKNRKNCHTEIQNVLSQISSIEGIFPESNNTLKITRSQLKNLIKEEMKESLSRHQSELSYSHTNPPESKKALQKSYWKAHRGPAARADIESQIGSMDVGNEDDRTIGDIVPIGYDEWESKKDIDKKRREELPHGGFDTEPEYRSEAISYLKELALNVAEGTVAMSEEDIAALDILTNDAFGWSFSYSVTGHGADFSAEASRDEYYDTKEEQATSLSELFKGQHKMKITRSQLKNLIKEEMARINEITPHRSDAYWDSFNEFSDSDNKDTVTVMYQDKSGTWHLWKEKSGGRIEAVSPESGDENKIGAILHPNNGVRTVVKDNSSSRSTQAHRRAKLDAIDADSRN